MGCNQKILSTLLKVFIFVFCLNCENAGSQNEAQNSHDYCVIGAGPGGLQMGYFLQRAERKYVIFEKANESGAFFQHYPRHRKLISINKRYTGKTNKEFNLRHDWNSLLSDDETLQVRHYSKEFFPQADDYVKYLNDYSKKLDLNIQYNSEISNITRHGPNPNETDYFTMVDQLPTFYTCKYVIISTGIATPNLPTFKGVEYSEGYETMSTDKDDYEGESVLILGGGNSAFETADHIISSTSVIHILSRSRVRLAWATHYVGDLRAVNNALLDTYQLKSLDGVLEGDVDDLILLKEPSGRIVLDVSNNYKFLVTRSNKSEEDYYAIPDNFPLRDRYDRVIRCLGFKFDFSIFDNVTTPQPSNIKKYPLLQPNYEAVGVPGLFFAGTNTHSLDFRKSAGAFIHGFRYTARALHRLLEYRNHQVPWPNSVIHPIMDLLDHILRRMNESSGLYQMFSILADVVVIKSGRKTYEYIVEFPLKMIHKLVEMTGSNGEAYIIITMEYGKHFSGPGEDTFRSDRATGDPQEAHTSNFLHPVMYYYEKLPTELEMQNVVHNQALLPNPTRLHHIVEDFLTDWSSPISHILVLRRFLETALNTDLRYFWDHQCFELVLTHKELPITCQHYMKGHGLNGKEELWKYSAHISI